MQTSLNILQNLEQPGQVAYLFPGAFLVFLTAFIKYAVPFQGQGKQLPAHIPVVRNVKFPLALFDLIERRLGDIDVALVNQGLHLAVKEGQQQGADVGAVNVCVGHQNQAVIAQFSGIKFIADSGAHGRNQGFNLIVAQHLVQPRLFRIDNLAFQGQDCLELPVPALLAAAAGAVAFHDKEFPLRRVLIAAVSQLTGQHTI